MNLEEIALKLLSDPFFARTASGDRALINGISGGGKAAAYSAFYLKRPSPFLIISENAATLAADMKSYLGEERVVHFPSWDTFPTEDISPSKEIVGERSAVLDRLMSGEKIVVVAKVKSAITRVLPANVLRENLIRLEAGSGRVGRDELVERLVRLGFKRRDIVGERGELSARGQIVDIFASNLDDPVRVEYSGDTVESIRYFDAESQRSKKSIGSVSIYPLHEIVPEDPSLYRDGLEVTIPEAYPGFSGLIDYFGSGSTVVLDGTETLKIAASRYAGEVEMFRAGEGRYLIAFEELLDRAAGKRLIEYEPGPGTADLKLARSDEFRGRVDLFIERARELKEDRAVVIASKQADRLYGSLIDGGLSARKVEKLTSIGKGMIYVLFGEMSDGFQAEGISLFTDREIFGTPAPRQKFAPKPREGVDKDLLADLAMEDHVVHENYGIGIYKGLKKLNIGGAEQEYLQIDYAEGDVLYVPLHQMVLVEKYTGSGGHKPKIGRLGGKDWLRTKLRARRSIEDMSEELLDIYSKRIEQKGFTYPPDTLWQAEFDKSFPYEETPDQDKAIREIKREMESGVLVDRLVCGDVGYGKTEVAVRAAFKTVSAGKQAVVLAPTTVLADQHFRTFSERFKPYPFKVELLSRFRSREEQAEVLASLENGSADLVIGTHRLLQKDVKFRDLGLIVVDEEQKFGVAHKERLRNLSKNVNVITLTATPIPRTLYMSLSGIREMSLIATPPLDRSPVRTYLREWNENTIKEVMHRELERGGQVYFVHNFVKTIDKVADTVGSLVPEAKVAVAHGQMKEDELEDIMIRFVNGEYDVLVSTSIIESGLDIPSVNTVLIDHAENFGLSQLYQIRGRVGRSSTRAFAYLLYHKENVLTEQAEGRLTAIQEFTSLGSGYKLAMADLEIRGAGNILGAEQHGHMLNVGFNMYCELLEESIRELKHIEMPPAKKVFIDLKVDAFLPADYSPDEKQRIALYKRMNRINTEAEIADLRAELTDRYGALPKEAETLLKIIRIKIEAGNRDIVSITGGTDAVEMRTLSGKKITIDTKGSSKEKWLKMVADKIRQLG